MNAFRGTLANVVAAVHVAIVAFLLVAPFTRWYALHAVFVPFLFLHWALNADDCCLSLLEGWLRGIPPTSSFVHRIVSPVYVIEDATVKKAAWIVVGGLWAYAASRTSRDDVVRLFWRGESET